MRSVFVKGVSSHDIRVHLELFNLSSNLNESVKKIFPSLLIIELAHAQMKVCGKCNLQTETSPGSLKFIRKLKFFNIIFCGLLQPGTFKVNVFTSMFGFPV